MDNHRTNYFTASRGCCPQSFVCLIPGTLVDPKYDILGKDLDDLEEVVLKVLVAGF